MSAQTDEAVDQSGDSPQGDSVDDLVMERPETTVVESTVGGSFIPGPGVDPVGIANEVLRLLSSWQHQPPTPASAGRKRNYWWGRLLAALGRPVWRKSRPR